MEQPLAQPEEANDPSGMSGFLEENGFISWGAEMNLGTWGGKVRRWSPGPWLSEIWQASSSVFGAQKSICVVGFWPKQCQ